MTTIEHRPNSALLVIDVQTDVVVNAHKRASVLANINSLVDRARAENAPVVWIQHADEELPAQTDGWRIASELDPNPGEPLVHKSCRNSFEETTLEDELQRLGVGRLVVTGAQSDYCVRWTLHGALDRGYDTVLVADAHTTDEPWIDGHPTAASVIAHTNLVWSSQSVPGRSAAVTDTAEVSFTAAAHAK